MALASRYLFFLTQDTLTVTMVSPTEGATVTDAEISVEWTFAPGTQSTYRVQVWDDAVKTTRMYDSGVISTGGQSHIIPSGSLDNSTTYYLQVDIVTIDGQAGQSDLTSFITSFAPSVNISGVTVTPVPAGTPPHNQIDWTQVTPGAGETFIRYNVYYKKTGTSTWTRVKTIDAIGTIQYLHYEVPSLNSYDYAVTWTATDGAGNTLESIKNAVADSLEFNDGWLQNTDDVTEYVQMPGRAPATFTPRQLVEMRRARGRLTPTAFISEYEATEISWTIKPQLHSSRDLWDDLKTLFTAQREEAAVLCFRAGHSGDRFFAQITQLSRSDDSGTYSVSISLQQVFFDEAV